MYNHDHSKNYGWRNYWNYVQIINHDEIDSETLSRIIENENHLGIANKFHYNLKIHKVPIDKILIFLQSDLYQDYISDSMTSEELHLYFTNLMYPNNFLFDLKFDNSGFIYFETFDGKKLFDRIPQQIELSKEILLLYDYID